MKDETPVCWAGLLLGPADGTAATSRAARP